MDYKYKAFISYRHLEPDMQAAQKLQKLLEAYKPPKNLGKTKENWRIFRDVSELQSSSDLSEDIVNAIESSEYLIVICSPKYTESKWCMQELMHFRELHGNTNKNIITLLVSGEPKESFPEELTYVEKTILDENGKEILAKVEVEPLAANIKADTTKESMKKLNTEYLRIAAPLIGCDFNDLYQREKRREAAKRIRIFGGASAILSLITIISVASAVTINGKNVKIKKQNDQIAQKNVDLVLENYGHLAVESENLYKENSLIPAISKAVDALPEDADSKLVIPEAEYALSKELGVYSHAQMMPRIALKHECSVEKLSYMGGGQSIVSQDATGIYFWDSMTGKLIKKITATDETFASKSNGASNNITAYFENNYDKTGMLFSYTGTPSTTSYRLSTVFNRIYLGYVHSSLDKEPGTGGDVYIYNSDKSVWRLDGATGEVVWNAVLADNAGKYHNVIVDDKYVFRLFTDKKTIGDGLEMPGDDVYLELIDKENGKVTDTVKITDPSIGNMKFALNIDILGLIDNMLYAYNFYDGKLYAFEISNHEITLKKDLVLLQNTGVEYVFMKKYNNEPVIIECNLMGSNTETKIVRYDKDLNEQKWCAILSVNYNNMGNAFLLPAADTGYEHDVLAVTTNMSLSFVDYQTGAVIKTIKFDDKVVDVSFSNHGIVTLMSATGEEFVVSLLSYTTGNEINNAAYMVQSINTQVSLCSYNKNQYVATDNYSNTAYVYYEEQNPMFTEIELGENMYAKNVVAVCKTGKCVAVTSTFYPKGNYQNNLVNHLFLYNIGEGGKLVEVTDLLDYQINGAVFLGDDKLIVNATKKNGTIYYNADDETYIVNVSDGKASKIADAPSTEKGSTKYVATDDGVFYLSDSYKDIAFITGDKVMSWSNDGKKEAIDNMCAFNDKRVALLYKASGDKYNSLEVYSFDTCESIKLECDILADDGIAVQKVFWQSADTVGVFLNNRTVEFFEATSGKLKKTVSLVGTGKEPISVVPISDKTFAVLCRDSKLYEMNMDGFSKKSCRLDFRNNDNNNIREYDSTNAGKLTVETVSNSGYRYIVWDDNNAWLLDTDRFMVRYRIDDYVVAPDSGDIVFIKDKDNNIIGYFPIYTTKKLLEIAKSYLKALGE